MTASAPSGITGRVEPTPRSFAHDQPSDASATDPPDAATGGYADYVGRLEEQIAAGRARPATGASADGAAAPAGRLPGAADGS